MEVRYLRCSIQKGTVEGESLDVMASNILRGVLLNWEYYSESFLVITMVTQKEVLFETHSPIP